MPLGLEQNPPLIAGQWPQSLRRLTLHHENDENDNDDYDADDDDDDSRSVIPIIAQANTPPCSLSLSLSLWTKTNEAHLPAAPASSNDNISIRRFYSACIRLTDMVKTFFGAIGIDTADGDCYTHGFEKK